MIPKALPPFEVKCDVMAVEMGWKIKAGSRPLAFAMAGMCDAYKAWISVII